MKAVLSFVFVFSVLALSSASAFAEEQSSAKAPGDIGSQVRFKVEKYKLPNGLTVLLHEDHSAPLISYQTWFRVGSKDEEPGLTGIAHLFEHMMFKGAKRYSGEQFDTILQANGATNNAFTTNDYTGYYENLPSSKLELVVDIESDRLENLKIDAENLRTERDVVKEERGYRVDNNPSGMLREALFSTAFKVHPYKWPVIGIMKKVGDKTVGDVDNVTVDIAQNFHRTYYAPNNAILVVAGDFKSDEAKKLIEKYYGAIKSQPIPKKTRPMEPAQTSPRSAFLTKDVQNIQFVISYQSPKSGSDEAYALDLLANILGAGPSSRLYQRLVYKDQIASSATAYNMTMQEAGMFEIMVGLKPGSDFGRAQRAVYGELWNPRNKLVSEDDLQKAKNQVMKSYVDGLKTIHGKAEAIALNEILYDDYEQLFKDLDRYNKVTAEQIKKAAFKYLAPERSTLVVLKPGHGSRKKRGH